MRLNENSLQVYNTCCRWRIKSTYALIDSNANTLTLGGETSAMSTQLNKSNVFFPPELLEKTRSKEEEMRSLQVSIIHLY